MGEKYYAVQLIASNEEGNVVKWFAGIGGGLQDEPYIWTESDGEQIITCLRQAARDPGFDKATGLGLHKFAGQTANRHFLVRFAEFNSSAIHTMGFIRLR